MRRHRDKAVLVSGGTSRIGQATAAALLEETSRVLVLGLVPGEVDAAVADLPRIGHVAGRYGEVSRRPSSRG